MGCYLLHADGRDVVEGGGQGRGTDVVGRASLELEGKLIEGGALEGDMLNHLAATLVGGHLVKPFLLAIKYAYTSGTIHLMGREDVEVGIQCLYINLHVGDGLCTVNQYGYVVSVGRVDDVGHGVDCAEYVAHMGYADQTGAWAEEFLIFLHDELALVGDGDDPEHDAFTLGQQLPGHDVAVVLHGRYNHFVTFVQEGFAKAVGHQVDALRGAARKDDFACGAGVDEAAHCLAGCFVQLSGLLREEMNAAVDVGVD